MSLGEKIQSLRKASGLSQEQLAEMLGVSRQAISKWETDQSAPEIEKILMISKAFSISTDELLGNDTPANAEAAASQLSDAMRLNMNRRLLTLGWITTIIGIALLVLEFFSLIIIQFNDMNFAAFSGYYSNAMEYAREAPMPVIFAITAAMIIVGMTLLFYSLHNNSGKRSSHEK